jgi:hypothetical protein
MKRSTLHPKLSKTGQITPGDSETTDCYSNSGLVQCLRICYSTGGFAFSFLFISAESLKNHSKS